MPKTLILLLFLGFIASGPRSIAGTCSDELETPQQRHEERVKLALRYNAGLVDANYRDYIRAEVDEAHQTIRIFNSAGRVPPGARARILFLHGLGASYSNHGAMKNLIKDVGDPRPVTKNGTRKFIQQLPGYIPVGAEAIDLPGSGLGPSLSNFKDIDSVSDWLGSYIKDMKKETPDLPIIVVARSSSPVFASEVARRNPGLIKAMVFISPAKPGDPQLFAKQKKALEEYAATGGVTLNYDVINWIGRLTPQIHWTGEELSKTPLLIYRGTNDIEVLEEEYLFYQKLAADHPQIKYVSIEGAVHDVFKTLRQL